ncbi:hypothetical protein PIB30_025269 [Stylosanthes scabra]|uniref:Retrotransposon Copia-like N-terminal domain-containing protein n=1 Tax=Stylosanthes scabra TaxID=79078 RepID=A0ABU6TC49_9FABA|nr:hypothetical protein [Stylosanthes scabra]
MSSFFEGYEQQYCELSANLPKKCTLAGTLEEDGIKSKSTMVLLLSSAASNLNNALIPLSDKLDQDNFSTWRKIVLLAVRTLNLEDHLSSNNIPPQFEECLLLDEQYSVSA